MSRNGGQVEFTCAGHKGILDLSALKDGKYPFKKHSTGRVVMLPKDYVDGRLNVASSVKPHVCASLNQGVAR